jgi:hypothetical protein
MQSRNWKARSSTTLSSKESFANLGLRSAKTKSFWWLWDRWCGLKLSVHRVSAIFLARAFTRFSLTMEATRMIQLPSRRPKELDVKPVFPEILSSMKAMSIEEMKHTGGYEIGKAINIPVGSEMLAE